MTYTPYLFRNGWEVAATRMAERFFASLPLLVPLPAYLCLHSVRSGEVRALLAPQQIPPALHLPEDDLYHNETHVLATAPLVRKLSELAEHHAAPEICQHIHLYNSAKVVLLHWYDAFALDSPIFVNGVLPEAAVKRFCDSLDLDYSPWQDD